MPTELIRKQFLLTDEENKEIEQKAANEGLSVSNFTRKLYGLEILKKGVPRNKIRQKMHRQTTESEE